MYVQLFTFLELYFEQLFLKNEFFSILGRHENMAWYFQFEKETLLVLIKMLTSLIVLKLRTVKKWKRKWSWLIYFFFLIGIHSMQG